MAGSVDLEHLRFVSSEDDQGRYRDTADHYSRIDIVDRLVEFSRQIATYEKKVPRYGFREFPRSVLNDCEVALRADERPIDRYLDNYQSYTNFDELEKRRYGFHGNNRVAVHATITKKDNLSVRLWLKILNGKGRWVDAPEWKDIPFYGHTAIMERPSDEVLFVRALDRLTIEGFEYYEDYRPGERRELIEAACELVNATFWLTVQRLSQRFEVSLSRYLVLLRERREGRILGLQIVDALDERKKALAQNIADFKIETGWSTEEFWAACDVPVALRRHYASEKLVRRLRERDGGTVKITRGEVDRRIELLSTAEAYGIWKPSRGADPEKVISLFPTTTKVEQASVEDQTPPPPPTPVVDQPRPTLLPHKKATMSLVLQVLPRELTKAASQFDAPSYAGLRSAPWTADLQQEFGIDSTEAFVAFVNTLRRTEGRLPVPQGSYPGKAGDLIRLVKEARLAQARQQQQHPER